MNENPFGMPDALPSGYGYADSQPATVRMNSATARGVPGAVHATSPLGGVVRSGAPQNAHSAPQVVRYSDLQAAEEIASLGDPYGASKKSETTKKGHKPYVRLDEERGLKYRVIQEPTGWRYRQYEDGTYSVTVTPTGKLPSGVKQNVPFSSVTNKTAFAAIKKTVEDLVGAFPAGAAVNYPAQVGKKGKKGKGGKLDVNALLATGGKIASQFKSSGQASDPTEGEDAAAEAPAEETVEAWYARKYAGVPGWGWAAGVTALTGIGLYFAFRKPTSAVSAAPQPRQIEQKSAAMAMVPSSTIVPSESE